MNAIVQICKKHKNRMAAEMNRFISNARLFRVSLLSAVQLTQRIRLFGRPPEVMIVIVGIRLQFLHGLLRLQ